MRRLAGLFLIVAAVLAIASAVVFAGLRAREAQTEEGRLAAARAAWPDQRRQLLATVTGMRLDPTLFTPAACEKPGAGVRCWSSRAVRPAALVPILSTELRAAGLADVSLQCEPAFGGQVPDTAVGCTARGSLAGHHVVFVVVPTLGQAPAGTGKGTEIVVEGSSVRLGADLTAP